MRILRSGYTGLVAILLVLIGPTLVFGAFLIDIYGELAADQRAALFLGSLVVGGLVGLAGIVLGIVVLVVRSRARRPA